MLAVSYCARLVDQVIWFFEIKWKVIKVFFFLFFPLFRLRKQIFSSSTTWALESLPLCPIASAEPSEFVFVICSLGWTAARGHIFFQSKWTTVVESSLEFSQVLLFLFVVLLANNVSEVMKQYYNRQCQNHSIHNHCFRNSIYLSFCHQFRMRASFSKYSA